MNQKPDLKTYRIYYRDGGKSFKTARHIEQVRAEAMWPIARIVRVPGKLHYAYRWWKHFKDTWRYPGFLD